MGVASSIVQTDAAGPATHREDKQIGASRSMEDHHSPAWSLAHGALGPEVKLSGSWTLDRAEAAELAVASLLTDIGAAAHVAVDLSYLERLDTMGAWLVHRTRRELEGGGREVVLTGTHPEHELLLQEVSQHEVAPRSALHFNAVDGLAELGRGVVGLIKDVVTGFSFLGESVAVSARLVEHPSRFRMTALVHQLDLIAFRSVPIIALISFLVGGIVAQQGIFQLSKFGASEFVVDLVGILTLRELGVLLTAIMIAGRSGSAFTAEIGSMKMREEIDAVRVMGLDPTEVLIIPRLLGLVIALPILTFLSDLSALAGGGLVAWLYGGMSPEIFLSRLRDAIGMNTFLVGIIKAPFMALIIAIIASIEGFSVQGSAESLGRHVTSSVVKAIFMVIVADGAFAVFFAAISY
jgi:phospholipid/cholesterol/gamma-HCH transport system permease protein